MELSEQLSQTRAELAETQAKFQAMLSALIRP